VKLPYHPHPGEVLICRFDDSAAGAEMIKKRPVVVVSCHRSHNRELCTVVPLSTTAPVVREAWHYTMPPTFSVMSWHANGAIWAKCDMLATVSFTRLHQPYRHTRTSGRVYVTHMVSPVDLAAIKAGIVAYLQLKGLLGQ
jgi:uncharacterized protein YifN (PemK superfamily)